MVPVDSGFPYGSCHSNFLPRTSCLFQAGQTPAHIITLCPQGPINSGILSMHKHTQTHTDTHGECMRLLSVAKQLSRAHLRARSPLWRSPRTSFLLALLLQERRRWHEVPLVLQVPRDGHSGTMCSHRTWCSACPRGQCY